MFGGLCMYAKVLFPTVATFAGLIVAGFLLHVAVHVAECHAVVADAFSFMICRLALAGPNIVVRLFLGAKRLFQGFESHPCRFRPLLGLPIHFLTPPGLGTGFLFPASLCPSFSELRLLCIGSELSILFTATSICCPAEPESCSGSLDQLQCIMSRCVPSQLSLWWLAGVWM